MKTLILICSAILNLSSMRGQDTSAILRFAHSSLDTATIGGVVFTRSLRTTGMWGWDGGVKFTDIVADGIDTFQVRWSWGDMVDGYSDSTFYANPPLPTNITRIFSYGKLIYEAKYRYGEKVE